MVKKHKKTRATRAGTHDLVARPKSYKLKPHHAKPYRKRHIGLLVIALAFLLFVVFRVGMTVGGIQEVVTNSTSTTTKTKATSNLQAITSSYGFSLNFDPTTFTPTATAIDDNGAAQDVTDSKLDGTLQINFVALKPKPNTVRAAISASQLSVQVQPDSTGFVALKADPANANKTDAELATQLQPITSSADFDVSKVSQANDTLEDGTPIVKTTYQYTPKFDGGISYAVVWTGSIKDRPFTIKLSGLVNDSTVPKEYDDILSSMRFTGGPKIHGLSFSLGGTAFAQSSSGLDSKYLADSLSPAVVKIYHFMCGSLVVGESNLGQVCDGVTGSGFFVSSDGYIATNGHVVVETPKDMFVGMLTANSRVFAGFLEGGGYSSEQIASVMSDPQKVAAIIVKIYDLDDSQFKLNDKKELAVVALGKEPLKISNTDTIQSLMDTKETDSLKRADIIGYNYDAKSDWARSAGSADDTSTSDVALLKINASNTPLIKIFSGSVTQNEKITILGFPGDAENNLVSNASLDVSVTDGSISAIKQAAGDNGKLYQSDADASHGNSGGPAVTESGEVIGLLTYRLSGDDQGNAAKSYIRDIADLTKLAQSKNVNFATASNAQDTWVKGLTLFSQNHFSAAKKEFQTVQQAYPAHRLVGSYIDNADKQIAAGNDVKLYPPVLIIGAIAAGVVLVGIAIVLIVRHRARHQAYVSQRPGGTSAAGGPPSSPPTVPQNGQPVPAASQPTPAAPAPPTSPVPPLISSITPPPSSAGSPLPTPVASQPTEASPSPAPVPVESQSESQSSDTTPTIIHPTSGA